MSRGKQQSDANESRPLTFLEVLGSTFAAAFGVQSFANRKRDFTRGNAVQFIVSGVLFVAVFVVAMIGLVNTIIGQAGG